MGDGRCRPLSSARRRVVQAAEGSRLMAGLHALWAGLADCPVYLYGLFFLIYGVLGTLMQTIGPLMWHGFAMHVERLLLYVAVAAVALPLAMSDGSLANALGDSRISRALLCNLLCVPLERLERPARESHPILSYVACFMAVPLAVVSLELHPLLIPLLCVGIALIGLIVSYPEAGVVLCGCLLPLVWLWRWGSLCLGVLLLLTWLGYGFKLLLMHRTFHMGRLDAVVLLVGLLLVGSHVCAGHWTLAQMGQTVLLLLFISLYFLIVNLMNDRSDIRRCLFGLTLTICLVILSGYIRLIPADTFDFLGHSRAGSYLRESLLSVIARMDTCWRGVQNQTLLLLLAVPWLMCWIMYSHRTMAQGAAFLFLSLDIGLLALSDTLLAMLGAGVAVWLFGLLCSHKTLSASLLVFPVAGGILYGWGRGQPWMHAMVERVAEGAGWRSMLWPTVWRMICDHPLGIGWGENAFAAVFPSYALPGMRTLTTAENMYLDVMVAWGWPGLLLLGALLVMFFRKCLSALHVAGRRKERAVMMGGISMMLMILWSGFFRGGTWTMGCFLMVWLALSVCSATGTLIFDDRTVLMARTVGDAQHQDRIYTSQME